MKIVWASPIDQRSAIGRFSVMVADVLAARGHEVDFVRIERDDQQTADIHLTVCPVRSVRDAPREWLQSRDAVLVNFGDNYLFHAGGLDLLGRAPCIGIFHDFYLHNLFLGFLAGTGQGEDAHREILASVYGEAGCCAAHDLWRNSVSLEDIAARFPMTEWVARHCAAAMAHSRFYVDRLTRVCAGPVAAQWLAWTTRSDFLPLIPKEDGLVDVLTIGVVNPNKCVDRVLAAIGGDDALRQCVQYRVAGPITDAERARLQSLAASAGYDGASFLGAVDDQQLVAEIERADIIVCLRRPVLEGGSASAIEGMLSKRPVIVADSGFYHDLPDDLVVKTPPDVSIEDVAAALRRLVGDEALRRTIGDRAADWGTVAFSPQTYADAVERLAHEAITVSPLAAAARHFGREVASLGLAGTDLASGFSAGVGRLFDVA
jgi:glycosyltransferase involved in cell wall biosynthesis